MNVVLTKGCCFGSLTVDGEEEIWLPEEKKTEIKQRICEWICSDKVSLNELLRVLVEHYHDEYDCDSEPCECCCNYTETFKWEMKEHKEE